MNQDQSINQVPLDEEIVVPSAEEIRANSKKKKKRKSLRTFAIIAVILLIIGGTVAYMVNKQLQKNAEVDVPLAQGTEVRKGEYNHVIKGEGKLSPVSSVIVNSELGGTVQEVFVVEGQTVKAGDKLFTTRNAEVNEALTAARAGLSAANEGVSAAKAGVSDAQSALNLAESSLASAKSQLEAAKLSGDPMMIEAAQGAVDAANQGVIAARQGVTGAKQGVSAAVRERDVAAGQVDKINRQLAAATVTAPIDGTIIKVDVKSGSTLPPMVGESGTAFQAIEIADLTKLVMRMSVFEEDVVSVKVGQSAEVTFKSLPGVIAKAEVIRVAPKSVGADKAPSPDGGYLPPELSGGGGGDEDVKYEVDVRINEPDPRLKYGMTAEANINVLSLKDVLIIPSSALIQEGSDTFVELMDAQGNVLDRKKITIGATNFEETVVESGLKQGDFVNPFPAAGNQEKDLGQNVIATPFG